MTDRLRERSRGRAELSGAAGGGTVDVRHSQGRQELVPAQQRAAREPPSTGDSGTNVIRSLSLAMNTPLHVSIKETILFEGL